MKVFYLDSALRNDLGHHAPSCRDFTAAFRSRGLPVKVFSLADITSELREELDAMPLFRVRSYDQVDTDPMCGHLVSFEASWQAMFNDLRGLPDFGPNDLVYFASVQPAQFMAAVMWYRSFTEDCRPMVAMEFGTDAGVDTKFNRETGNVQFSLRNFWHDPQPLFYRYAGRQLIPDARFVLSTFDEASSAVYSMITGHPVWTLPVPRFAEMEPFRRVVGSGPITIAIMGHQRYDKGYHLVPQIARMLLADCPHIRLLIHNGFPDGMPDVQAQIRPLAADPRVTIDERIAGPELWNQMLDQSDLIVSPYMPERFSASYSAVTCEAVAHAIPVVVPAETSLARLLEDFGNPGVTFDRFDPGAIVGATKRALAKFDFLADVAFQASAKWKTCMGAEKTVDRLLSVLRGDVQ